MNPPTLATGEAHFNAVCRLLAPCLGEEQAMTLDDITLRAALPNRRTTEEIMEHRLADFPYPLVASSAGYFRPITAEHINAYINGNLISRMAKLHKRRKTVMRKCLAAGWQRLGKNFVNRPSVQGELFEQQNKTKGQTDEQAMGLLSAV